MKVLLLGATGRTGKLILDQLLQRGHYVNALVRDKNKVTIKAATLTVFEGSTLEEADINAAINGCEAVISALNISRNNDFPWSSLRTPKDFLSSSSSNVINAANKAGVKRVIVISAWGVHETKKDLPWWFRWTIHYSNISYAYKDHEVQEDLLRSTDLDWTIIRPVGLTNFATKPVKVSIDNKPKPALLISRSSVAKFTVDILDHAEYIRAAPTVFN